MLRWKSIFVAALFAVSLPLAAQAQTLKLTGGDFVFAHAAVDWENPYDISEEPPGKIFKVTSQSFDGQFVSALVMGKGAAFPGQGVPFQPRQLAFTGSGEAKGIIYLSEPIDEVVGEFTGSFTWQTAEGKLKGTFYMQNINMESEFVFGAAIFITFNGGTGRFAKANGNAYAEGLDFPFGGPGGTAAVMASIVSGEIKLN